jgi:hypothetical protein
MAGIDSLVETFPSLAPAVNALGFTKTENVPADLPKDDLSDSYFDVDLSKTPFYGIPKSTIPKDLPSNIQVFRADPTGKFGGKEGLETQPISVFATGQKLMGNKLQPADLNLETSTVNNNSEKAMQELYKYARLNGAAQNLGLPSMTPAEMAAFAIKEGRSDVGHSGVLPRTKDELAFDEKLRTTYNLHSRDRNFLTSIFAKQKVAEKFKIPFAEAWNGTGTNAAGQTGKQYAQDYQNHLQAATHPKNQQLLNLIQRGIDDGAKYGLPLKENRYKDSSPSQKKVPYKKGGSVKMPNNYSDGNWKII